MGSAAPSSSDTLAGSAVWVGDRGEPGVPAGQPTCCPGPPPALWAHSTHPPIPRGPPSEGAPAPGPWDALSALLSAGAAEGAASVGSGGPGWGAGITHRLLTSPWGHYVPSQLPAFLPPSEMQIQPRCSSANSPSPFPRLPALGKKAELFSKCASRPPPPRRLSLCLQRPLPVLSPGWGVWADGSLSRKMPSPPAQPQPLASSSGCVLCVGGGEQHVTDPLATARSAHAPGSLLPGPSPPC